MYMQYYYDSHIKLEYAEITEGPGAGHYCRKDSEVGTGLKRSLSARHREGIHAGYPNALITPVDTLGTLSRNTIDNINPITMFVLVGFSTPGPYLFRPASERGPTHKLGMKLQSDDAETLGPGINIDTLITMSHALCTIRTGPAAYNVPSEIIPAPKIGERLDIDVVPQTPAPNEYHLPSSIKPSEAGKSISTRRELKSAQHAPPPNIYTIPRPRTASAHFTYRAFPEKCNCGMHFIRRNLYTCVLIMCS